MTDEYYLFDECSLDKEEVTLDNWKPKKKNESLIQSDWRKNQIGNNFNQNPGEDDLRKIELFLKKKTADYEIMSVFGINAKTLLAIKEARYSPMHGISLDNVSKIDNKFLFLEKKIESLNDYVSMILEVIFPEGNAKEACKIYLKKQKNEKKSKNKLKKNLELSRLTSRLDNEDIENDLDNNKGIEC